MEADRWLTVAQTAEELQIHPETVRRWLREGRLEGHNFGGRMGYRIKASEITRFLEREPESKIAA